MRLACDVMCRDRISLRVSGPRPEMLKAYHVLPSEKVFCLSTRAGKKAGFERVEYIEHLRILERGRKSWPSKSTAALSALIRPKILSSCERLCRPIHASRGIGIDAEAGSGRAAWQAAADLGDLVLTPTQCSLGGGGGHGDFAVVAVFEVLENGV